MKLLIMMLKVTMTTTELIYFYNMLSRKAYRNKSQIRMKNSKIIFRQNKLPPITLTQSNEDINIGKKQLQQE